MFYVVFDSFTTKDTKLHYDSLLQQLLNSDYIVRSRSTALRSRARGSSIDAHCTYAHSVYLGDHTNVCVSKTNWRNSIHSSLNI